MQRIGLIAVICLTACLNFIRLEQEGLGNVYYAAGVKSMLLNWHNFFFLAFDPAGFIALDKPPLGFWLQALSAKIFGFTGWSLLMPQALSGVISVYLLYSIVARFVGAGAGLVAALALALTPIFVATSRNNTVDGLLVMVLLLATRVFLFEAGPLRWPRLIATAVLFGIAFLVKSLQSFMVLPAFLLTYWFFQEECYRTKLYRLAIVALLMLCVSLTWFVWVDHFPPAERPYAGSSEHNSALELAIGYNGLGHFLGYGVQIPGRPVAVQPKPEAQVAAGTTIRGGQSGRESFSERETGQPGAARLFNRQLSGQIGWLLPFALLSLAYFLLGFRKTEFPRNYRLMLLFWGSWLLPQVVFFSVAQGFHRYYLIMLAPAIAGLVGTGFGLPVRRDANDIAMPQHPWSPILITIGMQCIMLMQFHEWRNWLIPLLLGPVAICLYLDWRSCRYDEKTSPHLSVVAFFLMFLAPAVWSITPALYGTGNSRSIPFAGPELAAATNLPQPAATLTGRLSTNEISQLVQFLLAQRKEEKFIVAVPNAQIAAPLILAQEKPPMTYGGFFGSEKILSVARLEAMIAQGQVRYVMIGSVYSRQPEIERWVRLNGVLVPENEWRGSRRGGLQLYDCLPR